MNKEDVLDFIGKFIPERDLVIFGNWLKSHNDGSFTFIMRGKKILGHDRTVKERNREEVKV